MISEDRMKIAIANRTDSSKRKIYLIRTLTMMVNFLIYAGGWLGVGFVLIYEDMVY